MFVLADVSVRMSKDEDDAWLHRGHLTRNSNNLSYSYQIVITHKRCLQYFVCEIEIKFFLSDVSLPVEGYDDNECFQQGQLTHNLDQNSSS
jgi:hypothetical protein